MTLLITILFLVILLFIWSLAAPGISLHRKGQEAKRLADAFRYGTPQESDSLPAGSLAFRLRAAGWTWKAASFRIITAAATLGVTLIIWMFLPGIPALMLGGITLYAPYAFLSDRIKGRGKAVDRELPLAISRLCAGLLAGGGVADVLEEVGKSLEGERSSGLASELRLTASDLRSKDRVQALVDLAARSPSLSLANLAFLLEGYLEVGGGKYTRILVETAAQLQRVLAARNRTRAKAGDAMLSARVIPVVLALVIASLSRDPMVHQSLASLPIQLILGLTICAMAGGYLLMRSMVSEAA
jgi:Flp pilus assembly protein TadB